MDTQEHGFFALGNYRPAAVSSKPSRRDISDEECSYVFSAVAAGIPRREIAETLNVPPYCLFDPFLEVRGKGRLCHPRLVHLPRRQGKGGGRPRGPVAELEANDPQPDEIRAMCEQIQATWTHTEHFQRLHGYSPDTYRPKVGMAAQRNVPTH